jgi:hypothetical protein
MLVAAVAIMGSFLVTWSNSSFTAQRVAIANQTDTKINLIRESFVIEDVWFYTQGVQKMNVTLRNTGDVAIKVTHIYINNTQVWTGSQAVNATKVAEISFNKNWNAGSPQSMWVKTLRGSEVKQVWKS